jgi:hypothetical protein
MNRMRQAALPGALALVIALTMATSAVGSPPQVIGKPLLDQFNVGEAGGALNGGSTPLKWQQEVTAGIAGQLTRLDLFVVIDPSVGETSATEVAVTLGAVGQEGQLVWSTTEVLRSGWNTFDLSKAKIFLEAGQEYAISIQGQSADSFNPGIAFSAGDVYPAGELFLNGSIDIYEGYDMLFRTYVRRNHIKNQ